MPTSAVVTEDAHTHWGEHPTHMIGHGRCLHTPSPAFAQFRNVAVVRDRQNMRAPARDWQRRTGNRASTQWGGRERSLTAHLNVNGSVASTTLGLGGPVILARRDVKSCSCSVRHVRGCATGERDTRRATAKCTNPPPHNAQHPAPLSRTPVSQQPGPAPPSHPDAPLIE